MSKKLLLSAIIMAGFLLALSPVAQAQGKPNFGGKARITPAILGTVSAVNGTTLTVIQKTGPNKTDKVYTVDASKANVNKNGASSTLSAVAVGDTVLVMGTINGTNVVAQNIRDGFAQNNKKPGQQDKNPVIQGNGQPVVAGKISAISGNTITITNNSNVTYTVDATNAKFAVSGVANPTISNVAVGDNVVVQGAVNGNSISASSVIVQNAKPKPAGFFGGVGNFFKKLFGF